MKIEIRQRPDLDCAYLTLIQGYTPVLSITVLTASGFCTGHASVWSDAYKHDHENFDLANARGAVEKILRPLQFREYVYCDNCQARIPRDEAHFGSGSSGDYCGCDACCAEPPLPKPARRVAEAQS